MKKISVKMFVSIAFCLLIGASLSAQLNVLGNGNVGIGVSTPLAKLSINSAGDSLSSLYVSNSRLMNGATAIRSYTSIPTSSNNENYFGIWGTLSSGYSYTTALYGRSYNYSGPQTSGRSYGVFGMAGNATSGYNYGMLGFLAGDNNGAAVFGTTSLGSSAGENTEGKFAGYFLGRVYVNNYLSVGNKNSSYAVDVTGTVRATTFLETSDSRLKYNIKNIDKSAVNTLNKLRGVSYSLSMPVKKVETNVAEKGDTVETASRSDIDETSFSRQHRGFLAQEVKEVFPELVYEDKDGSLSVDYIGLIPIIVEAVKSQNQLINDQNNVISELKSELENKKDISSSTTSSILYQNSPNPFNVATQISYYIPEKSSNAYIYIFSIQGGAIMTKKITSFGNSSISINGSDLTPGIYIYSLVVDGKEVDTKRMILTK